VNVLQTDATAAQLATAIADGPHTYQLTATNPAGQQSLSGLGNLFVDTIAPVAGLRLSGTKLIGRRIQARVAYRDLPPAGLPSTDASGVASVTIGWGRSTPVRIRRGVTRVDHTFLRPGRYTVTITATDKAGNVTRVAVKLEIKKQKPKPKPKPKPGKRHGPVQTQPGRRR
jgi:PKD domain